jgi:hypothetical protein
MRQLAPLYAPGPVSRDVPILEKMLTAGMRVVGPYTTQR